MAPKNQNNKQQPKPKPMAAAPVRVQQAPVIKTPAAPVKTQQAPALKPAATPVKIQQAPVAKPAVTPVKAQEGPGQATNRMPSNTASVQQAPYLAAGAQPAATPMKAQQKAVVKPAATPMKAQQKTVAIKQKGGGKMPKSKATTAAATSAYTNSAGDRVITEAPQRPSHIQASYIDAGSGKSFNTRFVPGAMMPGQQGYDAATGGGVWVAGGGTDEDVRAWYRSQDPTNVGMDQAIAKSGKDASAFSLGSLYGSSGSAATPSAAAAKVGKNNTIRKNLKIAGEGGITSKELAKISKVSGKPEATVVRQLDKVNRSLKDKGSARIALNAGAANRLIRQDYKQSPTGYDAFLKILGGGKSAYGTGRIGKTLESMMGERSTPSGVIKGQPFGGSAGKEPSYMTLGTQIRGGGMTAVNNFGQNQYKFTPGGTNTGGGGGGATDMGTAATSQITPMDATPMDIAPLDTGMTPQEMMDININMPGVGAELSNWATGYRKSRSARRRAGSKAQGLASQRIAPTGAWSFRI